MENYVCYISSKRYTAVRELAHKVKEGDPKAIKKAATMMARYLPPSGVLVPVPSHSGEATVTKTLAQELSRISSFPVYDVLRGTPREKNYDAKNSGHPVTAEDMGLYQTAALPKGLQPILVDNVIDTGTTAKAAVSALSNDSSTMPVLLVLSDSKLAKKNRSLLNVGKGGAWMRMLFSRGEEPLTLQDTLENRQATKMTIEHLKNGTMKEIAPLHLVLPSQVFLDSNGKVTPRGGVVGDKYYNVGEVFGRLLHIHKDYATTAISEEILDKARKLLPKEYTYNTLMYDPATPNIILFNTAPNFNKEPFPVLGEQYAVDIEKECIVSHRYSNEKIGDKYKCVDDGYKGFSVSASYAYNVSQRNDIPLFSMDKETPSIDNNANSSLAIEKDLRNYLNDVIEEYELENISIVDVKVIGSRADGYARPDSDLDVLVEYEGDDFREDALFDILHEEEHEYAGISIDFNPLSRQEGHSIKEYLRRPHIQEYREMRMMEARAKEKDILLRPTVYTSYNVDDMYGLMKKYPSSLPNKFYSHSTICYGFQPFDKREGEKAVLTVTGRLVTDKVDVLLVENKASNNLYPHITLATAPGVKPKESNKEIEEHIDMVEPLRDSVPVTFHNYLRHDDLSSFRNRTKEIDLRIMRQNNGRIYGWVSNGEIYLTPAGLNANTPVHEYSHLWCEYVRRGNPALWQSVKDVIRQTPLWQEVLDSEGYENIHNDEDMVAAEAVARFSGRQGAQRMIDLAKKHDRIETNVLPAWVEAVKVTLGKLWSWIGKELLSLRSFSSPTEVADRILYDLYNNTDIRPAQTEQNKKVPLQKSLIELSEKDCRYSIDTECYSMKEESVSIVMEQQARRGMAR